MPRVIAHISLDIVEHENFTVHKPEEKGLRLLLERAANEAEQIVIDSLQEFDGGVFVIRETKSDT